MNYNLGTARGAVEIDTGGLRNVETGLRQTGFALAGFGTALVGAFGYVIKVGAEFQREMSFVGAVTNATAEEMKLMEEEAINLGKTSIYTAREIAVAFVELAKAGLPIEDIVGGAAEAMTALAAAADIPLDMAATTLVNVMKTFQLEAHQAMEAVDILAGAANASTVDMDDLAYSMKYAGSVASAYGISLMDTATALAILGDNGIRGSTAGTSLRRILLNLNPTTQRAENALRDLGIITEDGTNKFFTAEGKAKDLKTVFSILGDATKDLSDEQRIQALNTIFGARAVSSAIILTRDAAGTFDQYADAIERTSAADVAAERLNNLNGAILLLKSAIEATLLDAGAPFQDFLKNMVLFLKEVVLFFGNLPAPVQTAILAFIAILGVVSLLGGMFFLTLAPLIQMIRLFGEMPMIMASVRNAFTGLTAVSRAFTLSLLTNPIFLVVAAIAALVAALVYLYFKWEPFRNFIDGLWQGIQDVWDTVLRFFEDLPANLGKAYDATVEILGKTFDWIKDNWAEVLLFLANPVAGTVNFVADNWDEIIVKANEVKEAIEGFVEETSPKVALAAESFGYTMATGFEATTEAVNNFTTTTSSSIESWGTNLALTGAEKGNSFVESMGLALAVLPERIGYIIGFAIGSSIRQLIDWGVEAGMWANRMVENVIFWVAGLPGRVYSFTEETLNNLRVWGPQVVQEGTKTGSNFLLQVGIWMSQLPGRVWGWINQTLNSIAIAVPLAIAYAQSIGRGIWDGIVNFLYSLPLTIGNIFNRVLDTILGMVRSAANAARDFASGIWNGIQDGLGMRSPSHVERAFWAMEDNVTESLANMLGQVNTLRSLRGIQGALTVDATPTSRTALLSTASSAASDGQPSLIVQGPLVEVAEANIRDESDITKVSRDLNTRITAEQLALGRKVLNA